MLQREERKTNTPPMLGFEPLTLQIYSVKRVFPLWGLPKIITLWTQSQLLGPIVEMDNSKVPRDRIDLENDTQDISPQDFQKGTKKPISF